MYSSEESFIVSNCFRTKSKFKMDSPIASRVVDVDDISLAVKRFHPEDDEGNWRIYCLLSLSFQ